MFGEIALPCSVALVWLGACSKPCLREWDPKNIKNRLKNNGLGHFLGTSFGGAMWTKSVPMQRGARFVLRRSAPMQRGAHFSILHVPSRAPCCAQAGHPKRYKTNAFLLILKMKGTLGAATTWIRKSKQIKINRKNKCFSQMPWVLFGVHFRWSSFCLPILGPQDGPPSFLEISVNAMFF